MNRVGGEPEGLQGHGAQKGGTSRRSRDEDRREFPVVEPDANFADAVCDAFAARELRRPLFQSGKLQPCDQRGWKERVRRAGIDEEIGGRGPVATVGVNEYHRDREDAHA